MEWLELLYWDCKLAQWLSEIEWGNMKVNWTLARMYWEIEMAQMRWVVSRVNKKVVLCWEWELELC